MQRLLPLLVALFLICGCRTQVPFQAARLIVQEKVIDRGPEDAVRAWNTEDGRLVIWLVKRNTVVEKRGFFGLRAVTRTKYVLWANGKASPEYDKVGRAVFSPDGKHIIHVGSNHREMRETVIRDGIPIAEHDGVTSHSIKFSPDGRRLAYVAMRWGKRTPFSSPTESFLVVDGAEGRSYRNTPPFPSIPWSSIAFAPDSSHAAYVATRNGKQFVVRDEVEGREHLYVRSAPVFSPDGRHLAYVAEDAEDVRVWRSLVLDGAVQNSGYYQIRDVHFSADGKALIAAASSDEGTRILVNGVEGRVHKQVTYLCFAPGGRTISYVARDGDCEYVVFGKQVGPRFERVLTAPYFSQDGKHVAYIAERAGRCVVVVAGKEKWAHDVSPEPFIRDMRVGALAFSPDARHVAYAIKRQEKQFHVVVDGVEGPACESVHTCTLQFSPDGKHVTYLAYRKGRTLRMVDGVELDRLCETWDVVFDSPRVFHGYDTRKNERLLVTVEIVPLE